MTGEGVYQKKVPYAYAEPVMASINSLCLPEPAIHWPEA